MLKQLFFLYTQKVPPHNISSVASCHSRAANKLSLSFTPSSTFFLIETKNFYSFFMMTNITMFSHLQTYTTTVAFAVECEWRKFADYKIFISLLFFAHHLCYLSKVPKAWSESEWERGWKWMPFLSYARHMCMNVRIRKMWVELFGLCHHLECQKAD